MLGTAAVKILVFLKLLLEFARFGIENLVLTG